MHNLLPITLKDKYKNIKIIDDAGNDVWRKFLPIQYIKNNVSVIGIKIDRFIINIQPDDKLEDAAKMRNADPGFYGFSALFRNIDKKLTVNKKQLFHFCTNISLDINI